MNELLDKLRGILSAHNKEPYKTGPRTRLMDELPSIIRRLEQAQAAEDIDFYKNALVTISAEFGITSPLMLIARAENEEETFVDILIKIIRERLATQSASQGEGK